MQAAHILRRKTHIQLSSFLIYLQLEMSINSRNENRCEVYVDTIVNTMAELKVPISGLCTELGVSEQFLDMMSILNEAAPTQESLAMVYDYKS